MARRRCPPARRGRRGTRRGRGTTCGIPSSRRARSWRASDEPLLLLPGGDQEIEPPAIVLQLGDGVPLVEQGPGGAGHHTLAARGAGRRVAPGLIHVGDDPRQRATAGDVPGVGPLHLIADADATGTEDATVVVETESLVAEID